MILDPDILELIGYPRPTAQDAADELLEAVQPTRPPQISFGAQLFAAGAMPLSKFVADDATRARLIAISKQLIEEHAAKPIRFADLTTA